MPTEISPTKNANTERDYRFDNLKGLLIILVVFAHSMEVTARGGVSANTVVSTVYSMIYFVHMPAFIFISGYFSKSFRSRDTWAKKTIQSSLLPFLIANLFYWILASREIDDFFYPQFAMWFLLSMFFWKAMVHPISRIKGSIVIAILLSLYVGVTNADKLLSLQRTFSFFPYFLAGFLTPKTIVERIALIKKRYLFSLVIATTVAVIALTFVKNFKHGVFTMSYPYRHFGYSNIQGILFRCAALFLGFTGVYLMIALSKSKKTVLSLLGKNTITVYLIHPLFVKGYEFLKFPMFNSPFIVLGISMLASISICLACGNHFVSNIYSCLINKISSLVFKDSVQSTE